MKGVVFTVFLEMVEEQFSMDMVDDILQETKPANGGAYTSVGTYPHEEMVALVVSLSRHSKIPVPDLLKAFGAHLFMQFTKLYPDLIVNMPDAFSLLTSIEGVIHAEVRKLYPDAQLPCFEVERPDARTLVMIYRSVRHVEDLCEGLIRGAISHYAEAIDIFRETLGEGEDRAERFLLTRRL